MKRYLETAESLILWDVVEEHLDEAEFLYEQWETSSNSAIYTLEELVSGPEERLEAHLDGLRVAGPPVLPRLIAPVVEEEYAEYARVVVALLTLLSVGERPANFQTVLSILNNGGPQQRKAAYQALLLSEQADVAGILASELKASHPDALRLLGFRGHDPGFGCVRDFYKSNDPQRLAAALDVTGLFGYVEARPLVESLLKESQLPEDLELRVIRTAAVLGSPVWSRRCYEAVDEMPSVSGELMLLLSCNEERCFQSELIKLLDTSVHTALWTLGFVGTVEVVEAILPFIESEDYKIARLAGEAFRAITGLDADDDAFHRDPEEPTAEQTLPEFEDDDLDADLGEDPTDELPLPQASKYMDYWSQNRANFETGVRYIGGERQGLNSLTDHIDRVSTRRRHHIAFQVRVLSHGSVIVPTWLWGRLQNRS